MATKNPVFIKYDNIGCPFKIGEKVRILNNLINDETFNIDYCNKTGVIIYFEYNCGCGQSFPNDPMIGVKFKNGTTEEFWKEELKLDS